MLLEDSKMLDSPAGRRFRAVMLVGGCRLFWMRASDGRRKSRWHRVLSKGWRSKRSSQGHDEL